eukprot:c37005_g1_i1.p1 GENE.c37005_g1_i1~~c37005_g1_i1.p1  ORF type:complete len:268 (-),score=86.52 c37005_g1_i1:59-793(-)
MGLLVGDVQVNSQGEKVSMIWAVSQLMRSDKKADRVEVLPEQILRGQQLAEELTRTTGKKMRVVGWYHSHPHITLQPSHVDIATQASYQQLDPGFVGLIFSVFYEDPSTKHGSFQIIAFQSTPRQSSTQIHVDTDNNSNGLEAAFVPLSHVSQNILGQHYFLKMIELQKILLKEESESFKSSIPSSSSSSVSPLLVHHNGAIYLKCLCRHFDSGCVPLLQMIDSAISKQRNELAELKAQLARYE